MKFAHIADVHLGNWREPKLKDLCGEAFSLAVDRIIAEGVDFLLISGDLYNTALPGIDQVKLVIKNLHKLKDEGIRVYYIAGSHDFSPSGKTMLDIIEEAKLGVNVTRGRVVDDKLVLDFTKDESGALICGMIGKRGMLEKKYYEVLDKSNLESQEGFKIFMFHTALDELKPEHLKEMPSSPVSFLPKGFDYYAGGHVHIVKNDTLDGYNNIVYPGPIFPANFSELWKLKRGSYYIYDNGEVRQHDLVLKDVLNLEFDFDGKSSEEINSELLGLSRDFKDKIVLLRFKGVIDGRISDLKFKELNDYLISKGAFIVLRNTSKLKTKDYKEISIRKENPSLLEDSLIKEHLGQQKHGFKDEFFVTKELIKAFSLDKNEGEKKQEYISRVLSEANSLIDDQIKD